MSNLKLHLNKKYTLIKKTSLKYEIRKKLLLLLTNSHFINQNKLRSKTRKMLIFNNCCGNVVVVFYKFEFCIGNYISNI